MILPMLDRGCEPLSDLNCIGSGAVGVVEDVEPCARGHGEGFLVVACDRLLEDFPRNIEREVCSKWD